ncbi:2Fe-2S iron-sulfur cluster-binding protein [Ilumatobacter sp.]|uniref:2Fe-2S iron-sulfur cluster-binding protein n=1 Tax=Ilumatobacter sp. TaxID=1967498 RepID=UPI0037522729
MAQITATANNSTSTFEVADGTKLVLALEENGVDILHKCGGYAKCTTCQVHFDVGEPSSKTEAEAELAENRDLGSARLSCQIEALGDMTLTAVMTVSSSDFDEPGPTPAAEITPCS